MLFESICFPGKEVSFHQMLRMGQRAREAVFRIPSLSSSVLAGETGRLPREVALELSLGR